MKTWRKDKAFWEQVSKKYTSQRTAGTGLGCEKTAVAKWMKHWGVEFSPKKPLLTSGEIIEGLKTFGGVRAFARNQRIDHSTVLDYIAKYNIDHHKLFQNWQDRIAPDQDKYLLKPTGDAIIVADEHCPFTDLKWVKRAVAKGKELGITQLVEGGDITDFDRLSYWARVSNLTDYTVALEDEFTMLEEILAIYEEQFDKIWILPGNHWLRLLQNITGSVNSQRLLGLVGKFGDKRYHFSEFHHWLLLDDKVRVTHPMKARKADGTLAKDISILHPEQWIVVSHRHRGIEGFTPDGRPMLEIGWMADVKRMRYVQHRDSTYFQWVNGFGAYFKGKLMNYTEYNTLWPDEE